MSSLAMYMTRRAGGLVPASHWAGEQFDELPQGLPMLCRINTDHVSQRTIEQNAKMHAMIADVIRQMPQWHGHKMSIDDWKCVFTASLKGQRLVPGLDNSLVVLGERTSHMSVNTMIDMIVLIEAFGAQHGLVFRKAKETA